MIYYTYLLTQKGLSNTHCAKRYYLRTSVCFCLFVYSCIAVSQHSEQPLLVNGCLESIVGCADLI